MNSEDLATPIYDRARVGVTYSARGAVVRVIFKDDQIVDPHKFVIQKSGDKAELRQPGVTGQQVLKTFDSLREATEYAEAECERIAQRLGGVDAVA